MSVEVQETQPFEVAFADLDRSVARVQAEPTPLARTMLR